MKVDIITIGDEILIGQIVDTNSAWMGAELNKFGFEIGQISSIHDDKQHILTALDEALLRSEVVLITGGLGPTKDDITKQCLCEYFDTKLVYRDEIYRHITDLLKHRTSAINHLTATQAYVPESCRVFTNTVGTAPIMWFDTNEKVVVSMPGVPHEMQTAMTNNVLPELAKQFESPGIYHKTIIVEGIPESALAIKIANWEEELPQHMHLAYLPNYGIVRLRLTISEANKHNNIEQSIEKELIKLRIILGDAIIAEDDVRAVEIIAKKLMNTNSTLATAESCTGGAMAQEITSIAGSSAYFKGTIVAYSNEIKVNLLDVEPESIAQNGAVSCEVVTQMAENARLKMQTTYAIATSGIAGPGGGTEAKPVGTVWIAATDGNKTIAREYHFSKMRKLNIERSVQAGFLLLNELIEKC